MSEPQIRATLRGTLIVNDRPIDDGEPEDEIDLAPLDDLDDEPPENGAEGA